MAETPWELLFHYSALSPQFASAPFFPSSPLFLSRHLLFLLSSSPLCSPPWFQVAMVTQLYPGQRPESQSDSLPSQTHTHASTVPVWRCQRPDESNDRLTSVYRPQLTSPWAAHKQLISLLPLFSFFSFAFACSVSFFMSPSPPLPSFLLSPLVRSNWVYTIGLSAAARSDILLVLV